MLYVQDFLIGAIGCVGSSFLTDDAKFGHNYLLRNFQTPVYHWL